MRIYPVLDLKGGLVVHGAGGRRESYRPVASRLVDSAQPLAVARAFRSAWGFESLYVADLDAIGGAPPAAPALALLAGDGFRLLVDAGPRVRGDVERLLEIGVAEVVAPLETLPGPEVLEEILDAAGAARVVFSLDLKDGVLLGDRAGWPFADAESLARESYRRGARRILVLDLAAVGSRAGPRHLELLKKLSSAFPDAEILAGGGIRATSDLALLESAGVKGALLASALHDGSITL